MKPNPHPVPSSVRKRFSDFFTRANTAEGLGITEDGSRWDIVRGVWRVFSNGAVAQNTQDHPMATLNMPFEDVKIELNEIDNGSAAALWVTGAGDWWSVGLEQEEVDCNCSQGTECNRWNSRNCARWNGQECFSWFCSSYSGSTNTGVCNSYSRGNCRQYGNLYIGGNYWVRVCNAYNSGVCLATGWNANVCTGNSCGAANASNCASFNSQTCNRWFEFTFDCETCYPQYVRVLQSVGNTISTVFSAIVTKTFEVVSSTYGSLTLYRQTDLDAPTAQSMRVSTQQEEIQVQVFEDVFLQSEIVVDETIVYTPTGAEITPTYGIMINPSSYNQTNYFGGIEIENNI